MVPVRRAVELEGVDHVRGEIDGDGGGGVVQRALVEIHDAHAADGVLQRHLGDAAGYVHDHGAVLVREGVDHAAGDLDALERARAGLLAQAVHRRVRGEAPAALRAHAGVQRQGAKGIAFKGPVFDLHAHGHGYRGHAVLPGEGVRGDGGDRAAVNLRGENHVAAQELRAGERGLAAPYDVVEAVRRGAAPAAQDAGEQERGRDDEDRRAAREAEN